MAKHNRKHNARPELPESVIIDLKGRNVGREDFETAALRLKFAEHEGFKGTDLQVAGAVAQGLEVASLLAAQGKHTEAAKQAGNCLWVLKKNREFTTKQNRRALGTIKFECRDGQMRRIGNVVEWYVGVHARIAEQIEEAKKAEAAAAEQAETEMIEATLSLKDSLTPAGEAAIKAA
jgi:hypothetical protein